MSLKRPFTSTIYSRGIFISSLSVELRHKKLSLFARQGWSHLNLPTYSIFSSPRASPWHSKELSQRAVLQPHQPLHPSEMLKLNILIFILIKVHIVQREIIIIIKLALHVPCWLKAGLGSCANPYGKRLSPRPELELTWKEANIKNKPACWRNPIEHSNTQERGGKKAIFMFSSSKGCVLQSST